MKLALLPVLLVLLTLPLAAPGCSSSGNASADKAEVPVTAADLAPIEEKHWKLVRLDGQDVTMADNQESEVFFRLRSDTSEITGFAGCNTFFGPYELEDGDRVRFGPLGMTMKLCPDVAVDESKLMEAFDLADNYRITGDRLDLNVGRRAPLATFEAVYFK